MTDLPTYEPAFPPAPPPPPIPYVDPDLYAHLRLTLDQILRDRPWRFGDPIPDVGSRGFSKRWVVKQYRLRFGWDTPTGILAEAAGRTLDEFVTLQRELEA